MTLNDVMAVTLRYFVKFGNFEADYVKVVEDTPIYCMGENVVQGI